MPRTRDYLLNVRFPTGGIRTHLKYLDVLAPRTASDPAPVLVCPDDAEGAALASTLGIPPERFASPRAKSPVDLALAIVRGCRESGARVIHSHGFTAALIAMPAVLLFRARHVVTVHDLVTPGLLEQAGKIRACVLGLVLRRAYAVHAVSEDCAASLDTLPFMRNASNVVTIPNGIDTSQFSNVVATDLRRLCGVGDETFLVGFFGRFMGQKGFRTLIDAIEIANQHPGVPKMLVICSGGGGFVREDRAYLDAKGLSSQFRFLDHVENVAPLIAGVDAVAMPSRWEAYGLLAAEVLTVGTPLVASTCSGLREVTRGTPARTFPPGDAKALCEALIAEAMSPSKESAREFAAIARQRFDFTTNAKRIRELLAAADKGMRLAEIAVPRPTA